MAPRNLLASARHIVVEGPIGVCKRDLVRRLGEHLDAQLVLEQPANNPFLDRFYQNQRNYALHAQLAFLIQRLDQLRDLAQASVYAQPVVADYLLEKDQLFAQLMLDDDQYVLYCQIYDRLAPPTALPDLVIYLQARPEVLIARVRKRSINKERKISDVYLRFLAKSYTRFFHNYDAAPVLMVNDENLNFVDHDDDFKLLVQRIETMRGRREYFNRGE